MANWQNLKDSIAEIIKTNGNQEITGQVLQNALLSIISIIGYNYVFESVAQPSTNPGLPDGNVFYITATPGVYSNFDGLEVKAGEIALLIKAKDAEYWIKKEIGLYPSMFYSFIPQLLTMTDESSANVVVNDEGNKISINGRVYFIVFQNGSYINFSGVTIDFSDKTSGFNVAYIEINRKLFTAHITHIITSSDIKYLKFSDSEGITYPQNSIILATYGGGKLYSTLFQPFFFAQSNQKIGAIGQKINTIGQKIGAIDIFFQQNGKTISLSTSNSTKNKYWGASGGKATLVKGPSAETWYAYNELIPVNAGDILRIFGGMQVLDILAYWGYDNDQNSTVGRVNQTAKSQKNGYIEFIIPDNCTLIGLSVRLPVGETLDTTVVSASMGQYVFTEYTEDLIEAIIGQKIGAIDIQQDLSAQYYQKGSSPKSFSKSICLLAAGQSNIDGRVPYANMPSNIKDSQPIAKCQYIKNSESGAFSSLNITGNWAFDLVTYYNIASVNNIDLYVIKWSQGGTSIDLEGDNTAHWTADYEKVIESGQTSLLRNFENSIRNHIKSNDDSFDIRAIIWHQGEGDRATSVAARYYNNLKYMIAYIRGIVGNETLPFITGTISHLSAQYNATIEAAQQKLASEDPNFYLIDMSGAPLLDSYHFNADSSKYFGEMVFNALIDAGVLDLEKLVPLKPW